jgi:hypothetical protein
MKMLFFYIVYIDSNIKRVTTNVSAQTWEFPMVVVIILKNQWVVSWGKKCWFCDKMYLLQLAFEHE